MAIHILPPEVANKIAAGEVVERPASVVKELIENALDAGATTVRVEIREGGIRLTKVMDNGTGIPAADVPLAVQRHATSKIARAEDLAAIRTLGFRGEALASIASVARLTLVTRHQEEEVGTLLLVEGGRELRHQRAPHPVGTTVTVEHLFFNTPARRKFLKTPRTEAGRVHQVVTHYALAFPEVRFTLVNDGRTVFQSPGNGRLDDVLVAVFGAEVAREMIAVGQVTMPWSPPGEEPRVWGFVSKPSLHRATRQHITLFLNRRWIRDHTLTQAVIQAYHTLLPTGRYPIAVIHIALDPHLVDVNVHPTKAEVRFRRPREVFRAVQKAVRGALIETMPVRQPAPDVAWAQPPGWGERRRTLVETGRQPGFVLTTDEPEEPLPTRGEATGGWEESSEGQGKRLLPLLRVVGQVAATYIVAEGPDGLYLIDQHAAHERVLYERLMAERARGAIPSQRLLDPIPVSVGSELAGLVAEHLDALLAVGFEIEPFGGDAYLVRAVPAVLAGQDPARAVEEVIRGLAEERDVAGQALEEQLVTLICKRAAVKAGQVLSEAEMRALVRELETCASPHTCPHGRPTMLHITAERLAAMFGRT